MLQFALHSHLILKGCIDEADPMWVCWQKHVKYVAFSLKNSFTIDDLHHLNNLIIDHHRMFVDQWPELICPKFHFILHLPRDIFLNGPSKGVSCMRQEARHRYFKRLAHVMNFIGVVPTMARRSARHTALAQYLEEQESLTGCVVQPTGCGSGHTIHLAAENAPNPLEDLVMSTARMQAVMSMCTEQGEASCNYQVHEVVKYCGHVVRAGSAFKYKLDDKHFVGVVSTIVELYDTFHVSYHRYETPVFCCDDREFVEAGRLDMDQLHLMEFNSSGMTFVLDTPSQEDFSNVALIELTA